MRHILKNILLFTALLMTASVSAASGEDQQPEYTIKDWQLKVRVGYNIGGTAPIGLPATIRSIDAFYLTANWMTGADIMLPLWNKWGLLTGIHFENKGMDGEVTTKAYRMKLKMDEDELEGVYTGHVRQKVNQVMFTIPVQAAWQVNPSVLLKGGPYVSFLVYRDFNGIASDGYLRKDNPTGSKVVMGNTEKEWATYDFSTDMRKVQFGLAIGADWQFYRNFGASLNLSWGLTGIMESDFKTVEQTLFPIYGQLGLFYRIK